VKGSIQFSVMAPRFDVACGQKNLDYSLLCVSCNVDTSFTVAWFVSI